jgi:hypothetical protein
MITVAGHIAGPSVTDHIVAKAVMRFGRIDELITNACDFGDRCCAAAIESMHQGEWVDH